MSETTKTEWYTRDGGLYEATTVVRNFGPMNGMLGSADIVRAFPYSKPFDANLDKGTAKFEYQAPCPRCGGAGGSSAWTFTGWVCFECSGRGIGEVKTGRLYTAERLAKLNATQAKREAKRAEAARIENERREAEAAAARTLFVEAHAQLIEAARGLVRDSFVYDLLRKLDEFGSWTPAQIAAVEKSIARAAEKAAAADVPAGRVTVEGSVLKTEWKDSSFGMVHKMLVKADAGYLVWGTVPGSLVCERGDRVRFVATVERSIDDPKFGFFKRPSRAEVVSTVDAAEAA